MLAELYLKLCKKIPADEAALFGLAVGGDAPFWLTIDANAFPAILLPASKDDLRPDIELRAVEALFSRACTISSDDPQTHVGCFSLIRLKDNDPDVVRLFLRIVEERFCIPNLQYDNAAIATNIQQIAALFSHMDDNTRDIIGLWGELFVISRATDTDEAVQCWSTRKTAKYDFVSDTFVLDVKTTLKTAPVHRFSLEQLRPKGEFEAYIASLCLVEVSNGQTVGEFVDSLSERIIDQELRSRFLIQCLAKGGRDLYRSRLALQTYPDANTATFFDARAIPAPQISKSDPIENVRFDIDLSGISPVPADQRDKIIQFQPISTA